MPAQFEPWDCRADLMENLDVEAAAQARRQEMTRLLCGPDPLPEFYHPAGRYIQVLRNRERGWTAEEVEAAFGDLADSAFNNLDEQRRHIKKRHERVLRSFRVLCLSENSASSAMWRDYADRGRGACIGFRYLPEIDNCLGAARPVEYVEKWPSIATPLEWARHVLFVEEIPFGRRARARYT